MTTIEVKEEPRKWRDSDCVKSNADIPLSRVFRKGIVELNGQIVAKHSEVQDFQEDS